MVLAESLHAEEWPEFAPRLAKRTVWAVCCRASGRQRPAEGTQTTPVTTTTKRETCPRCERQCNIVHFRDWCKPHAPILVRCVSRNPWHDLHMMEFLQEGSFDQTRSIPLNLQSPDVRNLSLTTHYLQTFRAVCESKIPVSLAGRQELSRVCLQTGPYYRGESGDIAQGVERLHGLPGLPGV